MKKPLQAIFLLSLLGLSLFRCKKGTTNNSGTYYLKLKVDTISINLSSDNYASNTALFSAGNSEIGISTVSGCNTGPNNPCFSFGVTTQYMAVGTYTVTDNYMSGTTAFNSLSFGLTNSSVTYRAIPSYAGSSNYPILTITITHVGNIGENITGSFEGTILKNNPYNGTQQLTNISGSFNVKHAG